MSRRRLLAAIGASAAGAVVLGDGWTSPAAAATPVTTFDGTESRAMAMHIHSSFSEGFGSMRAHLLEAQKNSVDVLWWTDHDHNMSASALRNVVHFTSLTGEVTDGTAWTWRERKAGSLASWSGGIEATGSPNDPIAGSSLALAAASSSTTTASFGYYADSAVAGYNERANLSGQSLSIEVLPISVGTNGYLELLLTSSFHPATGGRTAGTYTVSYRFGGAGRPGTRSVKGRAGVVNVPVASGSWNSVTLVPGNDIASLWPDMDSRDFASSGITLRAVSNGRAVSGNFDYLRFNREYASGDVPLQVQQEISAGYVAAFPSVTQRRGLEMSTFTPHVNWFGGDVSLPSYAGVTTSMYPDYMQQQVAAVHQAGGLASYNHPFGTTDGALLSQANQNSKMSSIAQTLLANRALGCDIIEVGLPRRAGVDLAHHVGLWDVLSRNARTITGNGTSDDHSGQNWAGLTNNWTTSVWAPSTSESDLLNALSAGRAWTSSLSCRVSLDLLADGSCPMGSVSTSSLSIRQLQVFASGVPFGGSVDVLRGAVDYAGSAALVPNTVTVGFYPDTAFASGSVSMAVDTSTPCFVRTAVRDAAGNVVALSNPIWMLREAPPGGASAARSC